MVSDRDIQALADTIVARFRPDRIVLFGSQARGEPGEESDVDLLVVLEGAGPRYKDAGAIRAALRTDIPLDVVVRRPHEFRNHLGDPLVLDALQHGRVLYAA
jgi:predicted nucleotidyltransferase